MNRARLIPEGDRQTLWFWCSGCGTHHSVYVQVTDGKRPQWSWNGSLERPTIQPSILVTYESYAAGSDGGGARAKCCHSYVTDGRIQYLGDCTHALAGKTVDLQPIEESMGAES